MSRFYSFSSEYLMLDQSVYISDDSCRINFKSIWEEILKKHLRYQKQIKILCVLEQNKPQLSVYQKV